jgi:hypothetical protein
VDRITEARSLLGQRIEAAGGIDAYRARTAAAQAAADAQRAQEQADREAAREASLAQRAAVLIQIRQAAEAGLWTVAVGQPIEFGGGFPTLEEAERVAESHRADGTSASTVRPYCGHPYNRYGDSATHCPTCARIKSQSTTPGR